MANKVNNNNDDFEQELAAYMQHMSDELSAAEALIQDMQNEQAAKDPINKEMNSDFWGKLIYEMEKSNLESQHALTQELRKIDPNCTKIARMFGFTNWKNVPVLNTSRINDILRHDCPTYAGYIDQLNAIDAKIDGDAAKLKAIDPNINGTVIAQLNQLLAHSDSLVDQGLRGADLNKALQQCTEIFDQLCNALMNSIRTDLAMDGMKQFGSDPSHAAAIMQFAGMAIQAEFQEQISLQNVQTDVIGDNTGWNKEKSDAEADLKTSHWYDCFTGGGPDSGKDHAEIRAANAMLSILSEVEKTVSSLIVTIDPGMQEFGFELDQIKAKFQQFLSGHGTIREIKDAMVAVLSILVGIIAETTKDAAMYDKEMNQGSMASSEMKLNDSLSQQEVIEDAKKYAAIMGKLIMAAKYIGMAVIFLLNPGIAMAVMVAIEAALTASGVMDKLQNALTSSCLGEIGGTIMMCGIEMVGTASGAAGIEAGIAKAGEAAATAATEVVEKTVQEIIEEVVAAAVKAAGGGAKAAEQAGAEAAEDGVAGAAGVAGRGIGAVEQGAAKSAEAAEKVADKTVRMAVETAQKKVAAVYMNKTVTELMTSFVKGDLQATMETAMKEAAENAGKEVQVLADTAAKQGSADVIGDTEIESIATTSANRAVADVTKTTEESVAKVGEKTALRKGVSRALWTGMAAAGSTDLPTDIVAASQHKNKKDLSEQWQIALQVIQTLMQFIGMIGASDIGPQSVMAPGPMSKLLIGASVAQGGLEAIGSAGEADADFEQAGAVKALAQDQSVLDMMQFIMSQLRKDGSLQRDQYSKEMQQVSKTNMNLAMHFNDANQAVAEAMSVLPV